MKHTRNRSVLAALAFAPLALLALARADDGHDSTNSGRGDLDRAVRLHANQQIEDGRHTFRYDTFGDEAFWGDSLRLHEGVEAISPRTALAAGLKVDLDALPRSLVRDMRRGKVDLDDPATTVALLRLNAVVGVTGFFGDRTAGLRSMGIQCALCHSTVDDSLAPGIGRRLDGWANRDLNVGAIINLAPNLQPVADLLGVDEATVRAVLKSWGPGRFDAQLFLDGKAFRPDGTTAATVLPPAFSLSGVNFHTSTGFGSVTYWNAFVANLEMHGQGTFYDPRLEDATQFPVAARAGFGNVRATPDLVTPRLAALHFYQLALPAPPPPPGSFDTAAATRGRALFAGKADCARCHVPPLYTEPGWNLHKPEEVGIDSFQADRSPEHRYRTTPLRGLWSHTKGGFYHDGRFPTLDAVVDHYDGFLALGLSPAEKHDLAEFLKSL